MALRPDRAARRCGDRHARFNNCCAASTHARSACSDGNGRVLRDGARGRHYLRVRECPHRGDQNRDRTEVLSRRRPSHLESGRSERADGTCGPAWSRRPRRRYGTGRTSRAPGSKCDAERAVRLWRNVSRYFSGSCLLSGRYQGNRRGRLQPERDWTATELPHIRRDRRRGLWGDGCWMADCGLGFFIRSGLRRLRRAITLRHFRSHRASPRCLDQTRRPLLADHEQRSLVLRVDAPVRSDR
jgi:hypothetical protein